MNANELMNVARKIEDTDKPRAARLVASARAKTIGHKKRDRLDAWLDSLGGFQGYATDEDKTGDDSLDYWMDA